MKKVLWGDCIIVLMVLAYLIIMHNMKIKTDKVPPYSNADSLIIYTQTADSKKCSKKLVITDSKDIYKASKIVQRMALFSSSVMPCGYDVVIDFNYTDSTNNIRIHINTECGYMSSDDESIGRWRRFNSYFSEYLLLAEMKGVDDEFCPSP